MNLGTLLAHHRGRRSLSDVATALSISTRTLTAIEDGDLPTGRTLAKLLYLYETDGKGPRMVAAQKADLFDAIVAAGGEA